MFDTASKDLLKAERRLQINILELSDSYERYDFQKIWWIQGSKNSLTMKEMCKNIHPFETS